MNARKLPSKKKSFFVPKKSHSMALIGFRFNKPNTIKLATFSMNRNALSKLNDF